MKKASKSLQPWSWDLAERFIALVGVDVARLLLLVNVGDGDQNAGLLHFPKFIVERGAEGFHARRQVHIGVDERRDVLPFFAHIAVKHFVAFFIRQIAQQLGKRLHLSHIAQL